jgi:hypothetical protein
MKREMILLGSLMCVLLLAACGGAAEESAATETVGLNEDYPDALPIGVQLALGSFSLEETDLAIDEAQAAELLPLWQAYQTLSTSDKAADAEVTAVLNQIQDTMTVEQIETISAMELTAEDITTAMQEMAGQFGRGFFGAGGEGAEAGEEGAGGGGFGRGAFPGSGIPGGGTPGGGVPGLGLGQGGADARATRIAEMGGDADDMMTGFMNQAVINALIRTLQAKTGELDLTVGPAGRRNLMAWEVISETTGIPLETLQTETAEGAALAEVITAHGGDLDAVKAALKEAYLDAGYAGEDLDQFIDNLLSGTLPQFDRGAIPDSDSDQP